MHVCSTARWSEEREKNSYQEARLIASLRISCNKFQGKLAWDTRKPKGQFAIMPDQVEAFAAIQPAAKLHCGCSQRIAVDFSRPFRIKQARSCVCLNLYFQSFHSYGESKSPQEFRGSTLD
jgi:nucleotidyltransferase/DNA polymerase involved in DNA repair